MKATVSIAALLLACFVGMPNVSGETSFVKVTTGEIVNDQGSFYGCAWADYDNDTDPDLFVAGLGGGVNLLYRNNGDGSFTKITQGTIVTDGGGMSCCAWGDYNNDGAVDLFVAGWSATSGSFLYRNDGAEMFSRAPGDFSVDRENSLGVGWSDYDNDGFLDMFVANFDATNFFYRNNGGYSMSRVTSSIVVNDVVRHSTGVAWADYDDDGDSDLFIANGASGWDEENFLYRNNGDLTFTKISEGTIVSDLGSSIGCAWGDYDNDSDLDLFVANAGGSAGAGDGVGQSNFLYRNEGNGTFDRITEGDIVEDLGDSVGCAWGDYDNDGFLDIFIANGNHQKQDNALYRNNGDGTFTRIEQGEVVTDGGTSDGCSWVDFDHDGSLDLFVTNREQERNFLYRNAGNGNSWVKVRCIGTATNRSAIGARVKVQADVNGDPRWQLREISSGDGLSSQFLVSHFGLGDAQTINTLRIEWPSGIVQEMSDVAVNQLYEIVEPMQAEFSLTPESGQVPLDIQADATSSTAQEGHSIVAYEWDFGDGATASGVMVMHTFINPGWFNTTLTITDDRGIQARTTRRVLITLGTEVAPWTLADLGETAFPGSSRFESECLVVTGAEGEISRTAETFQFVHQKISGDFQLTGRITDWSSPSDGSNVGVTIRESLEPRARQGTVFLKKQADGFAHRFLRRTTFTRVVANATYDQPTVWLRLERRGDLLAGMLSTDGETWTKQDSVELSGLAEEVVAGVAASWAMPPEGGAAPTATVCDLTIDELRSHFLRGDCNGDRKFDISDAVSNLNSLFGDAKPSNCTEACNANDDAQNDVSDAVYVFNFLFGDGTPPAAPYPACGEDPEPAASLGCGRFACD